MLSFLPREVLDEIKYLIESVPEGYPTYTFKCYTLKTFENSVGCRLRLISTFRRNLGHIVATLSGVDRVCTVCL